MIARTLGPDDLGERLGPWQALSARASQRVDLPDVVALHFPPGRELAGAIADLAVAEQDCCRLFDFSPQLTAAATRLEIPAPQHARALVEAVVGAPSRRARCQTPGDPQGVARRLCWSAGGGGGI